MKVSLIIMYVPALHLFLRSRSLALRQVLADPAPDLAAADTLRLQTLGGTLAAIVFALAAITLGRVKPRLGQHYGRTTRS